MQNKKNAETQKHQNKINERNKKIGKFQEIDQKFRSRWAKARKRIIKETSIKIDEKIMKEEAGSSSNEEARMLIEEDEKNREEIIKEVVQGRKFTLYLNFIKE